MVGIEKLDNAEEIKQWLRSFHRVMKKCPKNLWFFSTGELNIMITNKRGEPVYRKDTGGVDSNYKISSESENLWEGGDW